jgi:hypothetical protein
LAKADMIKLDEDDDVDDIALHDCKLVRMERMSNSHFWLAFERADGSCLTIDISTARALITARVRR